VNASDVPISFHGDLESKPPLSDPQPDWDREDPQNGRGNNDFECGFRITPVQPNQDDWEYSDRHRGLQQNDLPKANCRHEKARGRRGLNSRSQNKHLPLLQRQADQIPPDVQ